MFNTMNTVRPKPYLPRNNGKYNASQDGADKNSQNQSGNNPNQNQQPQEDGQPGVVGQARQQIYSQARNPYPQNNYNNIARPILQQHNYVNQINPQQYQAMNSGYQPIAHPQPSVIQSSSGLNGKSNKVNIAQILKDFRNTMKAIATPEKLEADVNNYLQIVLQQVKSPQPQVNLVQSNLKIAASLLDRYISETLNKESKVVQNWLDALFLQKINYNYNEEEINPTFLVKFPEEQTGNKESTQDKGNSVQPEENNVIQSSSDVPDNIQDTSVKEITDYEPKTLEEEFNNAKQLISHKPNITIIPQDTRLKNLFVEAKKQAFSNNPQKAMSIFREAFNRAEELKDTETQSHICLEIGKIYDDNDFVVQALNSYNKSLQYTTDTDVKSKAHYSIAQIYDDVNQVNAALDHYMTSISYAGKTDDLIGQSNSLTKVANIFTDKYDENAFEYYDIAKKLIEQTTDNGMKGYVLSNTADACVQFKKNDKALKYYAEAVKHYEKTSFSEEVAENYMAAAALMINFKSPNKAKSLLKKALVNAVKTQNENLITEINIMLSNIN